MYESHMLMSTGSLVDNLITTTATATNHAYYSRGTGNTERLLTKLETADVNMYGILDDTRRMNYEVWMDGDLDGVRRTTMMEQSLNSEFHSIGYRKIDSYGGYESAGDDEMTTVTSPFAPLYRHDDDGNDEDTWRLGDADGYIEGNRQVYGEEWVAYCCGKSFKDYHTLIEHDQACHQNDLVDDIVSIDPDGNIIYHDHESDTFLEGGDDENGDLSSQHHHHHHHPKWQNKNLNIDVAVEDEHDVVRARLKKKVIMTYRAAEETTGNRKGSLKSKFVGIPSSYDGMEKDYDERENGQFYRPILTGGDRMHNVSNEERLLSQDIEMISSHNLARTKRQRGQMMMVKTSSIQQPIPSDTPKSSLDMMGNGISGDVKNETSRYQASLLLTSSSASSSIIPAVFQDNNHHTIIPTTMSEPDLHGNRSGDDHQRSSFSLHSSSLLDGQLTRVVKPPTTLSEGEVLCSMKLTHFDTSSSRLRASNGYHHPHPLDISTRHAHYYPRKPPRKSQHLYQCSIAGCRKVYTSTNGLRYHEDHGHKEPTADMDKPYTCHIADCTKRFKSANGLSYHLKNAHRKSKHLHPNLITAATTTAAPIMNSSMPIVQPSSRSSQNISTHEPSVSNTLAPVTASSFSIDSSSSKSSLPLTTVQHSGNRTSSSSDQFPILPVTRQLNVTSPLNDLANSIATMRQRASSRESTSSPLDGPKIP